MEVLAVQVVPVAQAVRISTPTVAWEAEAATAVLVVLEHSWMVITPTQPTKLSR
jgi:hypothetical protein